jgi:hypothetical protein
MTNLTQVKEKLQITVYTILITKCNKMFILQVPYLKDFLEETGNALFLLFNCTHTPSLQNT